VSADGRPSKAAPGRLDPIGRAELVLAIPRGSGRARSQRELVRAAAGWPPLAGVRPVFREHLMAWIRIHALHASWGLAAERDPRGCSRPTRRRVCELGGFGVTTYRRCRRWWAEQGFVGVVRRGRTQWTRCMSRVRALLYAGNDAQVLVLCVPLAPPVTATAAASPGTRAPKRERSHIVTPASVPGENQDKRTALRAGSQPSKPAVTRALLRGAGLEKLSDRAVACYWRPFEAAAWSAADWLYAVAWRPDGTRHWQSLSDAAKPVATLEWRLSFWRDPVTGRPGLSRSQRFDAAARVKTVRQARERAERAELDQAAWGRAHEGPHPAAVTARARLASLRAPVTWRDLPAALPGLW
jgi:hypothetical protein